MHREAQLLNQSRHLHAVVKHLVFVEGDDTRDWHSMWNGTWLHTAVWRLVRMYHLQKGACLCKDSAAGREEHARDGAAALVIARRPVGPLELQRRQGVNSGSGRLHVQRNHIRVGWVGDARP